MQERSSSSPVAYALALAASLATSPALAHDMQARNGIQLSAYVSTARNDCLAPIRPASGTSSSLTSPQNKAAALLGVPISSLDRIRMQQSGAVEQTLAPDTSSVVSTLSEAQPLQPALNPVHSPASSCDGFQSSLTPFQQRPSGLYGRAHSSDEFLASERVPIRHTSFDAAWNRVRGEQISPDRLAAFLGNHAASGPALLAQVNRWANHNIAYVEDKDLFGRSDFWAGAPTTLALRKGDCEDIAIVKMQMLAAAGVRSEDMFLTIARDLVRNADHAVLVVRTADGFVLLDNAVVEWLAKL